MSKKEIEEEDVCPICNGTGEVDVMEAVYAGEPHMAPIGTAKCECRYEDDDFDNSDDQE